MLNLFPTLSPELSPKKVPIQTKNATLFANNYHMMADYFSEEGTKRQIRKHILVKYGRLMPVTHQFGIEEVGTLKLPSEMHTRDVSKSCTIQEGNSQLPRLMSNNKYEDINKNHQAASKDDLSTIRNNTVLSKFINKLPSTESWEDRLKHMVLRLEERQNQKSPQQKSPSPSKSTRMRQSSLQIDRSKRKMRNNSFNEFYTSPIQSPIHFVSDSEPLQLENKNIIILKNLYLY